MKVGPLAVPLSVPPGPTKVTLSLPAAPGASVQPRVMLWSVTAKAISPVGAEGMVSAVAGSESTPAPS